MAPDVLSNSPLNSQAFYEANCKRNLVVHVYYLKSLDALFQASIYNYYCIAKCGMLSFQFLFFCNVEYKYYINTNEAPAELSHENMISSCAKIICYLHM